ncbi:uroporphyrinogen-III synthase [Halobacillus seohaensis]|uniref:Uroporphyrinogen-III synthase n=1 Tax=Halobacillus seohaensis TaxID=447421 RepID=A0ABW2EKC3_9BACI
MKPLIGKKVLITRASSQSDSFIAQLNKAGATTIHEPLIDFQLNNSIENERIFSRLHDFSWVFITSSNGVKFFFEWLDLLGLVAPTSCQWAVVGSKTEDVLKNYGVKANFIPSSFQAVTMADEFFTNHRNPGNILYVRGNLSRDMLLNAFENKSVFFESITVYDTLLIKESETILNHLNTLDALTFTSPSTIHAFLSVVGERKVEALRKPCFCIGSTTAEEAKSLGFQFVYYPDDFTIESMSDQLIDHFS